MSQAGAISSRGDYFQILVAIHWLIRLLREPSKIRWVEVEVIALPGSTESVTVDDIVIGLSNGNKIFIQTKKNQTDFRAWSLIDLKDELLKAHQQWKKNPSAEIEFVSRTEFGDLRKLHEASKIHGRYDAFISIAPEGLKQILASVAEKLGEQSKAAFLFVSQLRFGSTQEFGDWESQNLANLSEFLPRAETALLVLQDLILKQQARTGAIMTPFTRDDLLAVLESHGLVPAPKKSEAEILRIFKQTSSIGRTWQRDIAGRRIPTPYAETALQSIEAGMRTILLTGGPGNGKTCVLLDISDESESRSNLALLFIKADQFKTAKSEPELIAAGLPADMVGLCARMSEYRRVVVAIDSLDVLSLSRHHAALGLFLTLIDRLNKLDNVSIVSACRKFDLNYDPQLRIRQWEKSIEIANLDFATQVVPFLRQISVNPDYILPKTRELLVVPNILKLYVILREKGIVSTAATSYEIFEIFIDELILKDKSIGEAGLKVLYKMANDQLSARVRTVPRVKMPQTENLAPLLSLGVLSERQHGIYEFGHQSWAEILSVRNAIANGQTLRDFIKAHTPLPFIRPSVRTFLFYTRARDPQTFSRHVRAVISDSEIPYHLRRLVAESLSEVIPSEEDWGLIRELSDKHSDLFQRLVWKIKSNEWFLFMREHWVKHALEIDNRSDLLTAFLVRMSDWMNILPEGVISTWREAVLNHWGNEWQVRWRIVVSLSDFKSWSTPGVRELLETLMAQHENSAREFLGKPISLFVEATCSGDDLLWSWIVCDFRGPKRHGLNSTEDLHLQPHELCSATFLQERMFSSEYLLNVALTSITKWSEEISKDYRWDPGIFNGLLNYTSWEREHSDAPHHAGGMELLFVAFEEAISSHVKINSSWWQQHRNFFLSSPDLALRYIFIKKSLLNITDNISCISAVLVDRDLFENGELNYELGILMSAAYPYLPDEFKVENQEMLLTLHREEGSAEAQKWITEKILTFLHCIPAPYKSADAQSILDRNRNLLHVRDLAPDKHFAGGFVTPPFAVEELSSLSNEGVLKLLKYYDAPDMNREHFQVGRFVGGKNEVIRQFETAVTQDPLRFSSMVNNLFIDFEDSEFFIAAIGGMASYVRYMNGKLNRPQGWQPVNSPEAAVIVQIILGWLEKCPIWVYYDNYRVHQAFSACAETVIEEEDVERLTILLFPSFQSASPIVEDSNKNSDLLTRAINSAKGNTCQIAVTVINRLIEAERPLPILLSGLLKFIAQDNNQSVRALLLHQLPFIVIKLPDFGWNLFRIAISQMDPCLWPYIERVLYYQYHEHYELVRPWLERLESDGGENAAAGWGRLITLALVSGYIEWQVLMAKLEKKNSVNAWKGCAQVFIANLEKRNSTELCQKGVLHLFSNPLTASAITELADRMFLDVRYPFLNHEMARKYLESVVTDEERHHLHGFLDWLAQAARENPVETLKVAESLVKVLEKSKKAPQVWNKDSLLPALTAILREADESDDSQFINRAVSVQDSLLKFDIHGIHELYDMASEA